MIEELNAKAESLLPSDGFDWTTRGTLDSDERVFYGALATRFGPSVASLFRQHEKRRVTLSLTGDFASESAGSYIGGHPFVSSEERFTWPTNTDSGKPLAFLMQLNLAEIPKLEGFPDSGLFQWWIKGDDDLFGMSFEADASGKEGLMVKFYPASALSDSASSPLDQISNRTDGEDLELGPLLVSRPFALSGQEVRSFPTGYEDIEVSFEALSIFVDAVESLDYRNPEDSQLIPFFDSKTQLGGYPSLAQGDPRYKEERPGTLILQLDSMATDDGSDVLMWGDSGSAQIFGDLEAFSQGDMNSLWWDWACY